MAAKQLLFSEEARRKLLKGVRQMADTVKVTMGPTGHNVIYERSYGSPRVTKDGVTVAKEIELKNPFENMGAKLIKEVASRTSDKAGDGTTTATVFAEAIVDEGFKLVAAGANPMSLKRGITAAVAAATAKIDELARPVKGSDDIAKIGAISANNDETIGRLLADAMDKVGKDGVITVEEGKGIETDLTVVEGMQFDRGFISPYFITKPATREAVLEDCYILLHEKKLGNLREMLPLLEKVAASGKQMLIISEDVEGEALAALVINKLRGVLHCCAVKAPGFGERRKAMLQDMAVLTNGKCITEDLGLKLESLTLADLGTARKVTVDKDHTTIVQGAGKKSAIQDRIGQIRKQIETTTSDYDREKLEERLAKLSGGVAEVRVGAPTELAMMEKKARVEDALHATRAAVEEGIVPGGGSIFLRVIPAVEEARAKLRGDEKSGADIIIRALEAPIRQIADNSGVNGAVVASEVMAMTGNMGFDANVCQYVDMLKAGIIDPAKVSKQALQNAASLAGLMLTTETLVTELKDDEEEEAAEGVVT